MADSAEQASLMEPLALSRCLEQVRKTTPLVHCITNYVTVNDCANALLACGASPIMSDEPLDVEDITGICGSLVLNIGTLNTGTIEGMRLAAAKATELGHPIILDPVGAGASALRSETASEFLDGYGITVIRGNMSEMKALAGASASTRGVDVAPEDVVTEENLAASSAFAKRVAARTGAVVAITGAIDIVADEARAVAIRNGSPLMASITGSGCMLSAITGAFAAAGQDHLRDAVISAVAAMGVAGEVAAHRMGPADGNGSFRTYLLDGLFKLDGAMLETHANIASGEE